MIRHLTAGCLLATVWAVSAAPVSAETVVFADKSGKTYSEVVPDGKNPWATGICSFIIPGLGEVMNGDLGTGALVFGTNLGLGIWALNTSDPGLAMVIHSARFGVNIGSVIGAASRSSAINHEREKALGFYSRGDLTHAEKIRLVLANANAHHWKPSDFDTLKLSVDPAAGSEHGADDGAEDREDAPSEESIDLVLDEPSSATKLTLEECRAAFKAKNYEVALDGFVMLGEEANDKLEEQSDAGTLTSSKEKALRRLVADSFGQAGNSAALLHRYGRAEGLFKKALKADPGRSAERLNLASCLIALKKPNQALQVLGPILESQPRHEAALKLKKKAEQMMKAHDASEATYEEERNGAEQ